ncbi:MAG: hypothetical protein EOM68_19375 [Spirochaetia bacterium]|nr:hypothetical protein [Spirochaetia bacterium]
MKRTVLFLLLILVFLSSVSALQGLGVETLYRKKQGSLLVDGKRSSYGGTELEVLLSSRTVVYDSYVVSFFGGINKVLSLTDDGVAKDVSSYPNAYFYDVGNSVMLPIDSGLLLEIGCSVSATYLQHTIGTAHYDLRTTHLRIGGKVGVGELEGGQFTVGLEYAIPLEGRIIEESGGTTTLYRVLYSGSAFGISAGFAFHL